MFAVLARLLVLVAAAGTLAACGGNDDGDTAPVSGPGPLEVALEHVGPRDSETMTRQTRVGQDEATVTLTFDGLRDDSVRSERHVVTLEREGDSWRVVDDRVTYRCQRGRGHQSFSGELCL